MRTPKISIEIDDWRSDRLCRILEFLKNKKTLYILVALTMITN